MTANVLKFGSPIRTARLAANPGSAENGEIFYNTTSNLLSYYENSAWQQVASRTYVQSFAAGLDPKETVQAATITVLPDVTYNNGVSGVGATLTADVDGVIPTIDGVTLTVGARLLVKNQAASLQNGIYNLTDAGSVSSPFILTRATDFDGSSPNEVDGGEYVFVRSGSQAGTGWVLIGLTTTAVIGTDPLVFTQFSAVTATLNAAYIGGNTITTSSGEGNVVIAGTEALSITAGGGLVMNQSSTTNEGVNITMTGATTAAGILLSHAGTGIGVDLDLTNASSSAAGLNIAYAGTGNGLYVATSNASSIQTAAIFSAAGFGNGLEAISDLGGAATFTTGISSTGAVLTVQNNGSGADLITLDDTITNNLWFKTGDASGGNSGGFLFETGTATGTRGSAEIRALKFLRGKAASENVEEEYFHSETLTGSASNTAVADFEFAHASYEGLKIDYKIKEATTNAIRVGTLYIGTNGTAATAADYFTENADVGVTWSVAVVGANVEVRYTTSANNKTMRADIKRIRA